jgi:hypothetical protein
MKTIISIIAIMFTAFTGFAQWRVQNTGYQNNYQSSSLVVNSYSTKDFVVVIDNSNSYNSNDDHNYKNAAIIGSLSGGNHTIEIYQFRENFWGRQKKDVIYSGTIFLKSGYETTISLNRSGEPTITERRVYNNDYDDGGGKYDPVRYEKRKYKHQGCGRRYDDYYDRDYGKRDKRRCRDNDH